MNELSAVANAHNIMFAMLVDELDKRGLVSKAEFASLLRETAASAEANAPDHLADVRRVDIMLMRKVADLLATERSGWTPAVIEGGRQDSGD